MTTEEKIEEMKNFFKEYSNNELNNDVFRYRAKTAYKKVKLLEKYKKYDNLHIFYEEVFLPFKYTIERK